MSNKPAHLGDLQKASVIECTRCQESMKTEVEECAGGGWEETEKYKVTGKLV